MHAHKCRVGNTSYHGLYSLSQLLGTYVTSHDVVSGILRLSKMAQNLNGTTYSYRADDDATVPFADDKPSGSNWGESQLKWFGIDIKRDCSLQEIAPRNLDLMPLAKVLTHIRRNLGKDWGDVKALGVEVDRETFYGALLNLLDPQDPIPSYATSLSTSSPQTAGPSATARTNQPIIVPFTYQSRAEHDSHGAPIVHGTPSPPSSWSFSQPPSPSPHPRDRPNVDSSSSEATDQVAAGPSPLAFERLSADSIRKLEIDVELTAGAFLSVINNGLVAAAKGAIERTFTR